MAGWPERLCGRCTVAGGYWSRCVALGGLAWGAAAVWQHVREHVVARDDYRLEARDVEITPSPPWVRSNVKGEALRDAGLTGPLSILDEQLIERLDRAFSLHPWVASVKRVSKHYPAHIEVELEYRRPVAMVEVPGGLYPVNVNGVLLPSEDFSPLEARSYPRLAGVASTPLGSVGSRWGDPVVAGGAAHVGRGAWPRVGRSEAPLDPLAKAAGRQRRLGAAMYELLTASGHVIQWGTAPESGPTGEPSGAGEARPADDARPSISARSTPRQPIRRWICTARPNGAHRVAPIHSSRHAPCAVRATAPYWQCRAFFLLRHTERACYFAA